jgi:adenylate cyclase
MYLGIIGFWLLAEKMKISLWGGKTFEIEVEPGAALAEHLANEFGGQKHTCRGHGRCGSCIALIESGLEDLQPPSQAESRILRILKAKPDQRLACQVRASSDAKTKG